jgi:hypothetical protein
MQMEAKCKYRELRQQQVSAAAEKNPPTVALSISAA